MSSQKFNIDSLNNLRDVLKQFKEVGVRVLLTPYIPDDMSKIGELYGDGCVPRDIVDCWCSPEDFLDTISEESNLSSVNVIMCKILTKECMEVCLDVVADTDGIEFKKCLNIGGEVNGFNLS